MPTPVAVITGKDGAVSLAGGAVNGKVTEWRMNTTTKVAETDGCGDPYVTRRFIRGDYTIDVEFHAFDQAAWDLHQVMAGTEVVYALKRKTADAQPYATGTALVTDHDVGAPHDNATHVKITIKSSTGDAPTLDTTPAT